MLHALYALYRKKVKLHSSCQAELAEKWDLDSVWDLGKTTIPIYPHTMKVNGDQGLSYFIHLSAQNSFKFIYIQKSTKM